MKLEITEAAWEQLEPIMDEGHQILRLYYDTEGLGCGVNGQPTIRLVNHINETDQKVENEELPVIIDHQQKVFFRKEMKLDLIKGTFRLSSPEGILNPIIPTGTVKNEVPL
ncbi:iron-sulfur cluster biosynthesis family protein [Halobacillus sp. A5]|uniref:iron-sulfur cluster biosynthesis family protein n=1 Tax=Halobacillus sp. A5 TaxID=2880263 RepID=UPI0020A695D7|nr:iron-sulfur cluster biosynthesis family protein [Halobacillus sp. A5]MCP3025781.1 iron-sulfur cluster biosynthesis family protein [Halobacillus sp. A5]